MSLLPGSATYAEEVSDYFLAFARGGLQLAPLDAECLLAWEDAGIPRAVVCRGILAAAEARTRDRRPGPDAKLPNLRSCAWAVEAEWRKRRESEVGKGT